MANRRLAGKRDLDPVPCEHILAVLAWQVQFPNHRFSSVSADKLARMVRDTARRAIREAMAEIEEDCSAEQLSLIEQELSE